VWWLWRSFILRVAACVLPVVVSSAVFAMCRALVRQISGNGFRVKRLDLVSLTIQLLPDHLMEASGRRTTRACAVLGHPQRRVDC
jgi:hypothetical protein